MRTSFSLQSVGSRNAQDGRRSARFGPAAGRRQGPSRWAAMMILIPLLCLSASAQRRVTPTDVARASRVEVPPPTPTGVSTYKQGTYRIHILENAGARATPASERSVLVLGLGSDAKNVAEHRNLINPTTRKRFDVIIGLGADNIAAEAKRVIVEGHFNAERNAGALTEAVSQHFGGALAARSLDTHSNGTTVAVTAIVKAGAFKNVTQLNVNGPDIGYANTYLNTERLTQLKSRGIESVAVYRNRNDMVSSFGEWSGMLVQGASAGIAEGARNALQHTLGVELSAKTVKGVQTLRDLAALPKSANLPNVSVFELETVFGTGVERSTRLPLRPPVPSAGSAFRNHYIDNYVNVRAGFVKDPGMARGVSPQTVTDTAAPKGVRIEIDDELLIKALTAGNSADNSLLVLKLGTAIRRSTDERARDAVLADFCEALAERFKRLRGAAPLSNVVVVSLRNLAENASRYASRWSELPESLRYPGPMSRINGFVLVPERDDVVLIGSRSPGEAAIELDDLIVGINSVWREGKVPFCSLDPDPGAIDGPQHVRVDGVPADSAFALKMLDADYLMKRILLGVQPVNVRGFESYRSLLSRRTSSETFANRFWLYPIQPQAGDVEISPDRTEALFLGGTQVLTEAMMQTKDGFTGLGTVEPAAERAAASMTRFYVDISKSFPPLQRLQGLFDIVLVAKLWRQTQVQSAALEQIVALPRRRVTVPSTYSGLRVEVPAPNHSVIVLGGGVHAKANATRRSLLILGGTNRQGVSASARRLATGAATTLSVNDSLLTVIPPDREKRDSIQLALATARTNVASGNLAAAMAAINSAIAADASDPEPFVFRASLHLLNRNLSGARADALYVIRLEPDNPQVMSTASTVLFQTELLEGKPHLALQWIERAMGSDPLSASSRVRRADALLQLGRTVDARAELRRAVELDPTSTLALARLGALEISEGWVATGRKMIDRASSLSVMSGQTLPEIKAARALAVLSSVLYGNVRTQLAQAQRLAQEVLRDPGCDPRSAVMALMVLTHSAMLAAEWTRADEYLRRVQQLTPLNPEALTAAAALAHELQRDDVARKYVAEAAQIAPNHPSVRGLQKTLSLR